MRKILLLLLALCMAVAMTISGPAAQAAQTTACHKFDIIGQDANVCMRMNYVKVSSTRMILQSVEAWCFDAIRFSSGDALDGYVISVTGTAGNIVWDQGDANSNVPRSSCYRIWDFADRTVNTQYFTGHYFGKARITGHSDLEFNIFAYSP